MFLTQIYFRSMFSRLAEMCGCWLAEISGCVGNRGNVEIVFVQEDIRSGKSYFRVTCVTFSVTLSLRGSICLGFRKPR
jgi:hypothetical protein